MAGDDSESKDLPPTQKKINDLRNKGQVAKSQEFAGDIVLLALVLYGLLNFSMISNSFFQFFDAMFAPSLGSFEADLGFTVSVISITFMQLVAPFFVIAIVISIIASLLDMRGIIFSFEAVSPKLSNVDPISGFGRLFNLRTLIEFIKSIIKAILLISAISAVMYFLTNDLVWSPSCGMECVTGMAQIVVAIILILGALIGLIAGAADLPISRALFLRDNKMSHSELKREQKEMFGSPEVRGERKRRQREAANAPKTGIKQANFFIVNGQAGVGLRYVRGETPAPIIMAKLTDPAKYKEALAHAKTEKIPVINDPALASVLLEKGKLGEVAPNDIFNDLARVMVQNGIIKRD
jgi:type III secretion protein U